MRIKELDAFRGLAALGVVLYHYTTIYSKDFGVESSLYFPHGWLGVPFFFILSGFVITLTIERCTSGWQFLKKRFIRLYPTFWICILITLGVIWITKSQSIDPMFDRPVIDILFNFTMFHELLKFHHVDGAYWSLLPELLFYLLMAFLFMIKKVDKILLYNGALLVICLIHYFFPIPIISRLLDLNYVLLFMIGICFYRIYMSKGKPALYLHALIIANLSLAIALYSVVRPHLELTILLISFPIIVLFFYVFVYLKFEILGRSKFLLFLGFVSYPLYLVHQLVGYIFMLFFDKHMDRSISILLTTSIAVLIATVITYYIEPPLKRIIKKIIFK
ncbi:acyltransferase [Dokdonia pacifica]|uniref:Peptidoglycan/LPS O-acetylase OafA/YrhL, contains acyltransferase and SGNH-hydrolase domains n=1 Tax=Dokdonia pacifica TaxID=1627892 RepID=A0A238Z199_9FLAO|nr:acyltransferase [Dokdonia pacifica]GGG08821.1 acyltransferase [Dokdonia pacifica]SNR77116.1 Peptidoglycan/LPS O-acetylase OafA/YrhL, contains acyltransferase and SGNH-hydrolase domains [Dokdonia pacifica]